MAALGPPSLWSQEAHGPDVYQQNLGAGGREEDMVAVSSDRGGSRGLDRSVFTPRPPPPTTTTPHHYSLLSPPLLTISPYHHHSPPSPPTTTTPHHLPLPPPLPTIPSSPTQVLHPLQVTLQPGDALVWFPGWEHETRIVSGPSISLSLHFTSPSNSSYQNTFSDILSGRVSPHCKWRDTSRSHT